MGGMTFQETITLVTVVASCLVAAAGFWAGRLAGRRTEGKEAGVLLADLRWIRAKLEEIERNQREQAEKAEARHIEVVSRLTAVEASAKQAHRRMNRELGVPPRI